MKPPDLILKNANVITMNPGQPRAELVAVSRDRISLVADSDGLTSLALADARIIRQSCQQQGVDDDERRLRRRASLGGIQKKAIQSGIRSEKGCIPNPAFDKARFAETISGRSIMEHETWQD